MSLLVGSSLERIAGERCNAGTRAARRDAAGGAVLGGALLGLHRLSAGLGAALVFCNVAAAQAAPRELGWTTPHLTTHARSSGLSQRFAFQDRIEAPQAAPAEPSPPAPPDDGLSARLRDLIERQERNVSAPGLERIDALVREAEPLSTQVYPLGNVPTDAYSLLGHAYVNGPKIWKELLELPRIQQAMVLQQAALWVREYRQLPPDQTIDIPAMIALLPAPERAAERPPTPSTGDPAAPRARLLELLEEGDNEGPRTSTGTGVSERILDAYPQSGHEMADLLEALTADERGLLTRLVNVRVLPLAPGRAPFLQESGVVEPVTLIPSTLPTDPEQILVTAYEWTSMERIELYRSADAAVRHAMRAAARSRILVAMRNAAAQEAAREAAKEQGVEPPVLPDPRLVPPEVVIVTRPLF